MVGGGAGLTEQVALPQLATGKLCADELIDIFNAFGQHFHAELVGQRRNGFHDGAASLRDDVSWHFAYHQEQDDRSATDRLFTESPQDLLSAALEN